MTCIKEEREALLKFKTSVLNDPFGLLDSWTGGDCCGWDGVFCNENGGHVIKLQLHGMNITRIDHSLQDLKHLTYLDLNGNDFQKSPIPSFIGFLKELKHLDLSSSSFTGRVPPHLGNLTNLHFLDFSYNDLHVDYRMEWIYNLSSLQYLGLRSVNLGAAKDLNLKKVLNTLPFLESLYLSNCQLYDAQFFYAPLKSSVLDRRQPSGHFSYKTFNHLLPKPFRNVGFLTVLDLSYNNFSCLVPIWLGNIRGLLRLYLDYNQFRGIEGGLLSTIRNACQLEILSLSYNNLHGNIIESEGNSSGCVAYNMITLNLKSNKLNGSLPGNDWLGQFKHLKKLDLSGNLLTGPILFSFLRNLSSVEELYLSNNNLNGLIPDNLGQLGGLYMLDIQDNFFEGAVSEVHFKNLSLLHTLRMCNQNLSCMMKSDWVPPFNLESISLQYFSTNGSEIPQWLRTQTGLFSLEISYTDITGTIPKWLGELSNLSYLDLSNNRIQGSIPENMDTMMPEVQQLNLLGNQINGSLPTCLCKMEMLNLVDVSENRLSGSIPDCWSSELFLNVMILSSNQLSDVIPNSLENLSRLEDLQLANNLFQGEIPSFNKLDFLKILDLGRNQLSGNITTWVGTGSKLKSLVILNLRENNLNGIIPSNLCKLQYLRILDLSNNRIMGTIPPCLGYFPAMMMGEPKYEVPLSDYDYSNHSEKENVLQVMKGREFNYSKVELKLCVNMDLSNNEMVGSIPVELTQLTGLIELNLSCNNFSGTIPKEIGRMKSLESLDLSRNHFFGKLRTSMLHLTFLVVLNLSHNNFSGHILRGNQFSTLNDPSSYTGNPYLCGYPLPECDSEELVQLPIKNGNLEDDEDKMEKMWLYIVIMAGYAIGFWGVIGIMMFKESWRHAYFQFVDEIKEKIHGVILVNATRLKRLCLSAEVV